MAAADLDYDPQGTNPANQFTGEVHNLDLATDRSVWPQNFPFAINDGYFQVEGRPNASGVWAPLQESVDFHFSPQFSEYSIASGREIVSYIVINNDSIGQVRIRYKALGQHVDTVLLAEIAGLTALNKLNRSSVLSWTQIKGSPVNYHPLVRDPNVIDRTEQETVYLGLERILQALMNPNSSTAILPKDITDIYLALGGKTSVQDVLDLIAGVTSANIEADPSEEVEIYRFSSTKTALRGVLHITEDGGGAVNCIGFTAHRTDNTGAWVVSKDMSVNSSTGVIPNIKVNSSGGDNVVSAICTAKVTYNFKLLVEFEGVF